VRKGQAPQIFAVLRHMALNLLKQEKSAKVGIQGKRLRTAWDTKYLLRVLGICTRLPCPKGLSLDRLASRSSRASIQTKDIEKHTQPNLSICISRPKDASKR